jgi:hypothetical protein
MTYEEAIQATVTREEANAEIEKHDSSDATWIDFLNVCGDKEEYSGKDVLAFLGY